MYGTHTVYEVEFDVPARHREAFETWLSAEFVAWVSHESVASFDVFRNEEDSSPEVKLVFGFERVRDWTTFVDSEPHGAAVETLRTLTENRGAELWQRASIKLDETEEPPVGDRDRLEETDRPRDDATMLN